MPGAGPRVFTKAMREELRRESPIFDGQEGKPMAWAAVMEAIADADVVIVGESHDDAVAHAIQLAIFEDVLERWPSSAVSMEMLDRSKQATVDDYLADLIDLDKFYERTASTRWRKLAKGYRDGKIDRRTFDRRIMKIGWPDWETNYQPIIDAAKAAEAPVIAANSPWGVYMSLANKEGYERLDSLTPAQKALFAVPESLPQGKYRERFWKVMVDRAEGEAPEKTDEEGEGSDEDHTGTTDEQVLGIFRGQLVMDATMADSIAKALRTDIEKIVHLVGHFHCDFEGGLVQELRRRSPGVRVLVITAMRAQRDELHEDDVGRADIIFYTGDGTEGDG